MSIHISCNKNFFTHLSLYRMGNLQNGI